MDTIQKNDSIILKGTNFKSKPIFASFRYPKFDDLVRHLMVEYGETITNGQPMKGKEQFHLVHKDHSTILPIFLKSRPKSLPVPIPLQAYFLPFYYSMLTVVGSDDSDTLVLTSPITENVGNLFESSIWSRKDEGYEHMLQCIENDTDFIPLTYNCTLKKLEKDWHKTVHLRKRNTVKLYVVPKPQEYFPMLFVNCSTNNIRSLYDNITALMISRNDPLYYCPFLFTCAIFRPIIFKIGCNGIEHRQRLPGIDVTDEEFVVRRTEWLYGKDRFMVSDCKCRSNTALLPSNMRTFIDPWHKIEYDFFSYYRRSWLNLPPLYTSYHCECNQHTKEKERSKDTEGYRE